MTSTALVVVTRYYFHGMHAASVNCCVSQEMALDELTTCFVLVDMRDCLKFLVFKLIHFYFNYKKMNNLVIDKT